MVVSLAIIPCRSDSATNTEAQRYKDGRKLLLFSDGIFRYQIIQCPFELLIIRNDYGPERERDRGGEEEEDERWNKFSSQI